MKNHPSSRHNWVWKGKHFYCTTTFSCAEVMDPEEAALYMNKLTVEIIKLVNTDPSRRRLKRV